MKEILWRIFYWVFYVCAAIMFASTKDLRSYAEFRGGFKKHEHTFKDEPYKINYCEFHTIHYHECSQLGCNKVNPKRYLTEEGKKLHGPDYRKYEIEFGYETESEPYFPGVTREAFL